MYVGAAGDFHPLHHDSEFARRAGYPSVFAPGMLTMALTGRVVTQMIAPESLRQFSGRFRAQVWPGDTLVVESSWSSTSGHETLSLTTRNQHGLTVFEGQASAAR
jgi:acyl dehydratase